MAQVNLFDYSAAIRTGEELPRRNSVSIARGKKEENRLSIPLRLKHTTVTPLLRRLDIAGWNRVHIAITAALGVGWLLDAF